MVEYVEIDRDDYHVLHPRPAYLIVSRSVDGVLNVMSASWVTPVSEEPPYFLVAVDRSTKTYENIKSTGEFTINIMGEEYVDIVYRAGSISGRDANKWEILGLKPVSSRVISVPGVEGALGFVECKLAKTYPAGECDLFLCEPMAIHVDKDKYTRFGWDLRKAHILMHMRGRTFVVPGRLVFAKKT